jgi:hypothetical protein
VGVAGGAEGARVGAGFHAPAEWSLFVGSVCVVQAGAGPAVADRTPDR